jgi:8-oxo-dGTP diphosphatase
MKSDRGKQKYTLGFIFDKHLKRVLLVHKTRPDWQKGKLNGIGGKYEGGETAEECIARETLEEADLKIPKKKWVYVGTIHQSIGNVGILTAVYEGSMRDAVTNTDEKVEWYPVDKLPRNVLTNIHWLVPLCLDKEARKFAEFSIQY